MTEGKTTFLKVIFHQLCVYLYVPIFTIALFGFLRSMTFRKTLDGEIKDSTKSGVEQVSKLLEEKEITETEEANLWHMVPPGANTAESLLNTAYFYKCKLFGLRTGEHSLMRVNDIVVFDEFRCKTFKVRLKDLKNKPRYIEHICHEQQESHSPCLASIYSLHIQKIRSHAESVRSFFFCFVPTGTGNLNIRRVRLAYALQKSPCWKRQDCLAKRHIVLV